MYRVCALLITLLHLKKYTAEKKILCHDTQATPKSAELHTSTTIKTALNRNRFTALASPLIIGFCMY